MGSSSSAEAKPLSASRQALDRRVDTLGFVVHRMYWWVQARGSVNGSTQPTSGLAPTILQPCAMDIANQRRRNSTLRPVDCVLKLGFSGNHRLVGSGKVKGERAKRGKRYSAYCV